MNNQENSNIFIDLEEKKHYDIGIVGWWYNLNYGGALTYFALHQTLKNMGLSVLMIEKMSFEKNYVPDYNQIPRRFAKKHYDICRNYAASELKKLIIVIHLFQGQTNCSIRLCGGGQEMNIFWVLLLQIRK